MNHFEKTRDNSRDSLTNSSEISTHITPLSLASTALSHSIPDSSSSSVPCTQSSTNISTCCITFTSTSETISSPTNLFPQPNTNEVLIFESISRDSDLDEDLLSTPSLSDILNENSSHNGSCKNELFPDQISLNTLSSLNKDGLPNNFSIIQSNEIVDALTTSHLVNSDHHLPCHAPTASNSDSTNVSSTTVPPNEWKTSEKNNKSLHSFHMPNSNNQSNDLFESLLKPQITITPPADTETHIKHLIPTSKFVPPTDTNYSQSSPSCAPTEIEKNIPAILKLTREDLDPPTGAHKPILPHSSSHLSHIPCKPPTDFEINLRKESSFTEESIERPHKCDACQYCDDVCPYVGCLKCHNKRNKLFQEHTSNSLNSKFYKLLKSSPLPNAVTPSPSHSPNSVSSLESFSPHVSARSTLSTPVNIFSAKSYGNIPDIDTPVSLSSFKTTRTWSFSDRSLSVYTPCQVRRHASLLDCWITAHGYVYNVSSFMEKHPGGIQCILKRGGMDCSRDFNFHSKWARENVWKKLCIGKVRPCKGCPQYVPESNNICTTQ